MTHYSSTAAVDLSFTGNFGQGGLSFDSHHRRPHIHILDDYSLLDIFSFSRPEILDGSELDSQSSEGGEWNGERWWYRLVKVCRRWRYIVLESAHRLGLSLVCARGTPVADMLAHSASLPLIIDHFFNDYEITAEDEKGIGLALQHRDRVRCIRLRGSASILQKLVNSCDGYFPVLEYLLIEPQQFLLLTAQDHVDLPETFRAPHLRHLFLTNFNIPIGSPLLTTTQSLVTLSLNPIPLSAYFDPNALLQRVSLMPQLEILRIYFGTHFASHIERHLLRTPVLTRVTLPNLRWLGFKGDSGYLDVILPYITLPLLEKLQIHFFTQLTYRVSNLRQFMITAENIRPDTIELTFLSQWVELLGYPHQGARMYTLSLSLDHRILHGQVESARQVFQTLRETFSAVEHLTLKYNGPSNLWQHIEPNDMQWRELLRSFVNLKTLFVDGCLVETLSRVLQPFPGESPTELLPELQELSCPLMVNLVNAFTPFIDARQKAGRPVTMINL